MFFKLLLPVVQLQTNLQLEVVLLVLVVLLPLIAKPGYFLDMFCDVDTMSTPCPHKCLLWTCCGHGVEMTKYVQETVWFHYQWYNQFETFLTQTSPQTKFFIRLFAVPLAVCVTASQ